MITEDQSDVVAFLESPATHDSTTVERIDTHASIVFLAGSRALKLKRAVRYDYLDFSTAARRKAMCEAEVRLNRRTAPSLYKGTLAITREPDGSLMFGGRGTPVDWVVEMVRFNQHLLFDRLAVRDGLDSGLMLPLARAIARLHSAALPRPQHGGKAGMAWVIDGNALGFREQGAGILDPARCEKLTQLAYGNLERVGSLLDARRDRGLVRECHGDLHLRNIVLLEGEPTLFDGVEFNPAIACIDVVYDLAFLLMDLWRRRLPGHANAVWNHYLGITSDFESASVLPLFLSCRAAVRAKTSATSANLESHEPRRGELQQLARDYLAMAECLLEPRPPCVVAVGGFSGSGKTTLARALAPTVGAVPGALLIRSDEVRKQLCAVEPSARLTADAYTFEVSRAVYETIFDRTRHLVDADHAVITDAVFARVAERNAIEQVAADLGAPFVGLWLEAAEPVLTARVEQRKGDTSDANASVVHAQVAQDAGPIRWRRIDAWRTPDEVLQSATRILEQETGCLRLRSCAAE